MSEDDDDDRPNPYTKSDPPLPVLWPERHSDPSGYYLLGTVLPQTEGQKRAEQTSVTIKVRSASGEWCSDTRTYRTGHILVGRWLEAQRREGLIRCDFVNRKGDETRIELPLYEGSDGGSMVWLSVDPHHVYTREGKPHPSMSPERAKNQPYLLGHMAETCSNLDVRAKKVRVRLFSEVTHRHEDLVIEVKGSLPLNPSPTRVPGEVLIPVSRMDVDIYVNASHERPAVTVLVDRPLTVFRKDIVDNQGQPFPFPAGKLRVWPREE